MKRFAALLALALLAGCAGSGAYFSDAGPQPAREPRALAAWPWQEVWTGVVFQGRKVGFARLALRPAATPGRWEIETESALQLRFLGVDKKVGLRALDEVRADLALERFRYEYHLDGSRLAVAGERDGDALVVRTDSSGARREQRLSLDAPTVPASALALLPAQRGLNAGERARVAVFVGESQSLEQAELRALAHERSPLFEGVALRVATTLLGLETEAWYDAEARPLLETALHGAMLSALEEPARARAYLVEASLNKDESLLEFSLLRSPPVREARRTAALTLSLEGVPAALDVPGTAGQRCVRDGARLECRVDRRTARSAGDASEAASYLRPSLAVPSNERRFLELAQLIVAGALDAEARIERLLVWMDGNIAKAALDAFSAADVLRERRAECQGHAYLFAAFARALGLPTRVVNGVVYSAEHGGFLYHTWNEVWLEGAGWRAVDPTFGQSHADATHVALAVGETPAAIAPLAAMVGRARVAAIGEVAHW